MKRTLIALFATAALAIPAVAQQQNPNQKSDQNMNQDQNKGQDQNAGQNAPDPSMDKQSGGSIHLTRAQTRMLQQALNSGGLDAGPIDGIMGGKTKEALKKYQSQKGLDASGQVDRQTMAALLSERGKQTASRKGHEMSPQHHDQGQQGSRQ